MTNSPANKPSPAKGSLLSTNRIEALTDGIFAIAMTLMILNLEVPQGITPDNIATELPGKLLDVLPSFETYAISFIVLGVFWLRHQLQFKHIKNADRTLIFFNLIILMLVALIPFTTNIVMTYPGNHVSFNVYALNLILISYFLYVHWKYAADGYKLIDASLPRDLVTQISRLNLIALLLFILSFAASFVSIRAALLILYINPLYFYFYHKYKRYKGSDYEES